jgi:hypothetical protein
MGMYFITFRSVTHAQQGERILAGGGIRCTLMRTPKWMENKGCGYSLRLRPGDVSAAVEMLRHSGVPMRKVYIRRENETMEEVGV